MDITYFKNFLGDLVEQMLRLMAAAETLAGKKHVLDALTVVIDRIKSEVC